MHSRHFISFLLLLSVCFFACKKVDIGYEQELFNNQYTQIVLVDTFTADLATVYIDSFATSAKGVTLVGGYNDSLFGHVMTRCFFDLTPPTFQNIYDSTKLDSLYLILRLNRSYYGDTTSPLHIEVRELTRPIMFSQPSITSFYNNQSFGVDSSRPAIGSADVVVYPTFYTDSITIRLNDALGDSLLTLLQNSSDTIQSSVSFLDYFYGLCLSTNSATNLVLGCKDSVIMRLSYERPGVDSIGKYHTDFTLANKQHHFNNITVDRSKTPLKNLGAVNNPPISRVIDSKLLNNQAYSQYISGVATKITFPSLADLFKIPNFKQVVKAQLKVVPVKGSYNTNYYLPPSLNLAVTDLNNGVGPALTSGYSTQTGNLYLDYALGSNTDYTYDLTAFVKQYLTNPVFNNTGLLLVPPSPALVTQFPRVVVGNQNQPVNFQTILEIYYVTVQ